MNEKHQRIIEAVAAGQALQLPRPRLVEYIMKSSGCSYTTAYRRLRRPFTGGWGGRRTGAGKPRSQPTETPA